MALTKNLLRVTVIGGLATGGLVLLAGPQRVGMLFDQARTAVVTTIDDNIDDPVVLRNQLKELEAQYPDKIAKVQGELAELDQQLAEFQRDVAVADRVMELAQADLDELQPMLSQAEAARNHSPRAVIKVHWGGVPMDYDQALNRAKNIRTTYNSYASKVAETTDTIDILTQQRARLADLLNELREEHASFKTQIAQLDGQINAIERNERLITMVEEREKTIAQLDRHEAHSLSQVQSKLQKIRAQQEARLEAALSTSDADDYTREAEEMLSREAEAKRLFDQVVSEPLPEREHRIDITPSRSGQDRETVEGAAGAGPVADATPKRIDIE